MRKESEIKNRCTCAVRFIVKLGRTSDYKLARSLLQRGRHPSYVGPQYFFRCANNGGTFLFCLEGQVCAAALICTRRGVLNVLNVHPSHRAHGLGAAIMRFLKPNFVRSIESAVPWFERQGYIKIGKPHRGSKMITFVMARKELFSLAGNLNRVFGARIQAQTRRATKNPGARKEIKVQSAFCAAAAKNESLEHPKYGRLRKRGAVQHAS